MSQGRSDPQAYLSLPAGRKPMAWLRPPPSSSGADHGVVDQRFLSDVSTEPSDITVDPHAQRAAAFARMERDPELRRAYAAARSGFGRPLWAARAATREGMDRASRGPDAPLVQRARRLGTMPGGEPPSAQILAALILLRLVNASKRARRGSVASGPRPVMAPQASSAAAKNAAGRSGQKGGGQHSGSTDATPDEVLEQLLMEKLIGWVSTGAYMPGAEMAATLGLGVASSAIHGKDFIDLAVDTAQSEAIGVAAELLTEGVLAGFVLELSLLLAIPYAAKKNAEYDANRPESHSENPAIFNEGHQLSDFKWQDPAPTDYAAYRKANRTPYEQAAIAAWEKSHTGQLTGEAFSDAVAAAGAGIGVAAAAVGAAFAAAASWLLMQLKGPSDPVDLPGESGHSGNRTDPIDSMPTVKKQAGSGGGGGDDKGTGTGGSDGTTGDHSDSSAGGSVIAGDGFDTRDASGHAEVESGATQPANPNPYDDFSGGSGRSAFLHKVLGIGWGEMPTPDGPDDGTEGSGRGPPPGRGPGYALPLGDPDAEARDAGFAHLAGSESIMTALRDHVWNPDPDNPYSSQDMPNPDDDSGVGGPKAFSKGSKSKFSLPTALVRG